MDTTDPAKRIPKSLGTETKLVGTYSMSDVAVGLLPAVFVVLVLQVVLPSSLTVRGYAVQTLTLPLAGTAVVAGAVFVYLTPAYTTSLAWLGTFLTFKRQSKRLNHEATPPHTRIERVHPHQGVIERSDGAYVGMVRVDPPSLALATDAEWQATAEAFQDFCNTVVEFPIQIYSTTREFAVEDYLARYEARLDDPDVKANPQLAALIEHYVAWYATDLEERRTSIRDHYVVVPVTPAEVQFEQDSLLRKLAGLPLIGILVRARYAPRREEERAALVAALDERLRRVENGLREIDGCHARRVDVEDATRLVGEFWAGQSLPYGDMGQVVRTRPIVGGDR